MENAKNGPQRDRPPDSGRRPSWVDIARLILELLRLILGS